MKEAIKILEKKLLELRDPRTDTSHSHAWFNCVVCVEDYNVRHGFEEAIKLLQQHEI